MSDPSLSRAERIDLFLGRVLAFCFALLGAGLIALEVAFGGSTAIAFILGAFFLVLSGVMIWLRVSLAGFLGSVTSWFGG